MRACLSDHNLAALVEGSASDDEVSAWKAHIGSCDGCAMRLARKQMGLTGDDAGDGKPGTDATVTSKPVGKPNLDAGADQLPADAIPGYRILKELHRGGQGVVYQAVQRSTKRKVALKVMLEGPFAGPESKRRFEREIELVGSLRHPHIVPIFDSGVSQGRFYYAMEYIRGQRLTAHVETAKLSVDDTLRLFVKICDAVDYAHQRGVIHRDLKPSNILVDERGDPYVLDFGLAKIGGAEAAGDAASMVVSVTGQVVGTLQYMSPEHAAGKPHQIDMRSDVYSLGVVLYELLTGQLPYDLSGQMAENLTTIQQAEPQRPGTIRRQVNDEVETIVLKALSKDKPRRYNTAGALGEDIERFLAGDPIEAKRDSGWYVLKKNLRRYKAPFTIAASIMVVILVAFAVSLTFWRQAANDRDRLEIANQHAGEARREAFEARDDAMRLRDSSAALSARLAVGRALTLCEQGDVAAGMLWFVRTLELVPPDAAALRRATRINLAAWSREFHPLQAVLPHEASVHSATFSPDGSLVLTAGADGAVRFWQAATGDPFGSPLQHNGIVDVAIYNADGSRILTSCADGFARLWDAQTFRAVGRPMPVGDTSLGFDFTAFSPNGKIAFTAGADGTARLWDAATGELLGPPLNHDGAVQGIAFQPGGTLLLTGSQDNRARFWDRTDRTLVGDPLVHPDQICAVAFSPDGRIAATASEDGTARLWDVETRKPIGEPLRHADRVQRIRFSPDGSRVLTGSNDNTARLWNAASGEPIGEPVRHDDWIWGIAFAADSSRIATASYDGTARVCDAVTMRQIGAPLRHQGSIIDIRFSPSGNSVVTAGQDQVARIWNVRHVQPRSEILVPLEQNRSAVFSPDRTTLALIDASGKVGIWKLKNAEPVGGHNRRGGKDGWVAFPPDGAMIATTENSSQTIRLWNAATGERAGSDIATPSGIGEIHFTPDGAVIGCTARNGDVPFWNVTTGQRLDPPIRHLPQADCLAFSPDGSMVATGGVDNAVRLWDFRTRRPIGKPLLHDATVEVVCFSPDGATLVSGCNDQQVRLWNVAAQEQIGRPMPHDGGQTDVVFSPDGQFILSASYDKTARLWDASTQLPLGPVLRHNGQVIAAVFSLDGRSVLTTSHDAARRWPAPPAPAEGAVEQVRRWVEVLTGLELDADGTVQALDAETWRERRQQLEALGGPPIP